MSVLGSIFCSWIKSQPLDHGVPESDPESGSGHLFASRADFPLDAAGTSYFSEMDMGSRRT